MIKRKFYSPAHIKNPTSLQHIVWLQPGQTLIVHLDPAIYEEPSFAIMSPYLSMLPCEGNDKDLQFIVIQDESLLLWGQYSACFLGEIHIESKKFTSKLVVMMACTNHVKNKVVTAINPDCVNLRVKPYNIIEVILFDITKQGEVIWEWEGDKGIAIEQIGYDYLSLSTWQSYGMGAAGEDPDYSYARLPRTTDTSVFQHHFWFRFEHSILDRMNKNEGRKFAGDLRFWTWDERDCVVSFDVDLRNKHREETLSTLAALPNRTIGSPPRNGYMSQNSYVPLNTIRHCLGHRPKQYFPMVRDVEFWLLDNTLFEDGCKTLDAIPQASVAGWDDFPHDLQKNGLVPQHYHFPECNGIYDWWE